MSINCNDLRLFVVLPALEQLGLWSQSAENLLLGTAAQESLMGTYLHQVKGPALGIYQMEPDTHDDIWNNFLKYKPDLAVKVHCMIPLCIAPGTKQDQLITNLIYATAMARLLYLRVPAPLPKADDVEGLANYWKRYYNTPKGKGTTMEFIKHYIEYVR